MGRYALLRRAQSDLRDIRDFILRDNPARAVTFVDELLDRCQLLADHPLLSPLTNSGPADSLLP
jgi:toxin ParE1/3/4